MDALIVIRAPSINHYQPPYIFQGESEERVRHVYGGLPDQHPAHQESTGAHVRPQLSGNWTISIDFRIENVTLCWFFIISICIHLVRFKLFKLIMVSFLFYLWTFLNYFIYSEPVYFNNINWFIWHGSIFFILLLFILLLFRACALSTSESRTSLSSSTFAEKTD